MTYRNVVSAVVRALAAETITYAGGCDFVVDRKQTLKHSTAVLPAAWYNIDNWDNDGKPESTRYRWRSSIRKTLNDQVNEALSAGQELLDAEGLIESCAV